MAIIISIGKWGGIYWYYGIGWRICLGWIAITFFPNIDGDDILEAAAQTAGSIVANERVEK